MSESIEHEPAPGLTRRALPLDHLVIATGFDLAHAQEIFSALGFTLGPMGHHALGSVNHVILFEGSYLELIGVPREGPVQRQEVLEAPKGIDGLVFATEDAEALHGVLTAQGLAVQPVQALARDVQRDGRTQEARFRVLRARPGSFEAGRVYYCQQLTPQLVWLPEYMGHANQTTAQTGLTLVAEDPHHEAARYASWAAGDAVEQTDGSLLIEGGGFQLRVVSTASYAHAHGDWACDSLDRSSFFGAIHLRTPDMAATRAVLERPSRQFRVRPHGDTLEVAIPAFNTLLVFGT
jgi:hypothetical protein